MLRFLRVLMMFAAVAFAFAALAGSRLATAAAPTPAEGCMKQWLFNGIWRVKVTAVDPYMQDGVQTGWQVTEVWRNGASQTTSPGGTLSKPQVLELTNGGSITTGATAAGSGSDSELASHDFAASAQFTHVEIFRSPGSLDASNKPKAVDITFDGATLSQYRFGPKFTTGHYDYRFKLDCIASAAVANAAGGSSEVPGKDGCMNQWMSNGVWRMRSTAIGPDSPSGQQIGWAVTETWTNQTRKPWAPGDTFVTDQQLVFADGNTLSSSNSAGSMMAQGKLMTHTFAPGESFTFQELFRPSGFDATETPVKLLVTFNAASENNIAWKPHYTANPANFRIKLTCGR